MRGTLFLIVGPSGAGKDTLIAAARERLPATYVFPPRTITRPPQPGAEHHIATDASAFDRQERAGAFALTWRAHGLAYGIPATIETELANGKHVVVNVSRAIVDEAKARFVPARSVLVTASPAVLSARLTARGREADVIEERLDRTHSIAADKVIVNDGDLEPAVAAFVIALQG